jgi:hypothetical protein
MSEPTTPCLPHAAWMACGMHGPLCVAALRCLPHAAIRNRLPRLQIGAGATSGSGLRAIDNPEYKVRRLD